MDMFSYKSNTIHSEVMIPDSLRLKKNIYGELDHSTKNSKSIVTLGVTGITIWPQKSLLGKISKTNFLLLSLYNLSNFRRSTSFFNNYQ